MIGAKFFDGIASDAQEVAEDAEYIITDQRNYICAERIIPVPWLP
jgi:hypothetical protein